MLPYRADDPNLEAGYRGAPAVVGGGVPIAWTGIIVSAVALSSGVSIAAVADEAVHHAVLSDRSLSFRATEALYTVNPVMVIGAAAFVAAKMHIPVIHIEAGLRSFDRTMPEEINRLLTDAVADLLFVTEESGRRNLLNEGIPKHRIHFVGNLMIDSLHRMLPRALKSPVLGNLGLRKKGFGLLTLHRPSNVDDPKRFSEMLDVLAEIAGTLPLVFPMHPRTRAAIGDGAGRYGNISFIDPLGYSDFVCLMANSFAVFTVPSSRKYIL